MLHQCVRLGVVFILCGVSVSAQTGSCRKLTAARRIPETTAARPVFDLRLQERSPFPSDRFTVADNEQNTARRVNLPMPEDCTVEVSECEDIAILNQLDGFNLNARISVPFDGDIDPSSVNNQTVFLVSLGDALARHQEVLAGGDENFDPGDVRLAATATIGINHIVWTPDIHELSFRPDQTLDQHTTYVLVVTTGVRDSNGEPIGVADGFRNFRRDLAHDRDRYYRRALLTATWAVARVAGRDVEVAALSVFTTQTATHIVERMREAIYAAPAPTLNFNVGLAGERAVFADAQIAAVTQNSEINVAGPLTLQTVNAGQWRIVPGAVGTVAYGTYRTLDFTARPSGHVAPIPTRTGVLTPTGEIDVAFGLWLPAGTPPPDGWPVAIYGHGSFGNKNSGGLTAAVAASHGVATLVINVLGRGWGPRTTMTVTRTDGTALTLAAPGLGWDQNGDGRIGDWEPRRASAPYAVLNTSGSIAEGVAQHFALVRALQAGVDVDGDGAADLDGARIYYVGQSLGSAWGLAMVTHEAAVRAAVFVTMPGPLPYNNMLSTGDRPAFGADILATRTPSLINSADGMTSLDGVAVGVPHYNENLPLRDQPPLVNTVPGAVAIQRVADRIVWATQSINTLAFMPLLRRAPPSGVPARPFILQWARSDQLVGNPLASEVIRTCDCADRVSWYRHDLNFGNPGVPANPHAYYNGVGPAFSLEFRRIGLGAQHQVATFFESDGATVIHPTPTAFWEAPINRPLPDDLFFLPR